MRFRPLRSSLVLVAARAARLPTIVVTDTRQAEAEVELPGVRGATALNAGAGVKWASGPDAYAIKSREFLRWLGADGAGAALPDDALVVLADGDVAYGGCDGDSFRERYDAIVAASGGAPLVFGAELGCWPHEACSLYDRSARALSLSRSRAPRLGDDAEPALPSLARPLAAAQVRRRARGAAARVPRRARRRRRVRRVRQAPLPARAVRPVRDAARVPLPQLRLRRGPRARRARARRARRRPLRREPHARPGRGARVRARAAGGRRVRLPRRADRAGEVARRREGEGEGETVSEVSGGERESALSEVSREEERENVSEVSGGERESVFRESAPFLPPARRALAR